MAFHDAIALANWINALSSTSVEAIEVVFKEYKTERVRYAKEAQLQGSMMASVSARVSTLFYAILSCAGHSNWLLNSISPALDAFIELQG